ncbi:MAG: GNAT family N-acetyltransferase [Parvularcula sp.]|jgi:predicted N-acyltransferase|nr:GNAT family N-acetyltransferase [Parvularcula sp.]
MTEAGAHQRDYTIETVHSLLEVPRDEWDRVANPKGRAFHPFVSWDFLEAMERSGSARAETGWQPCHILLRQEDRLCGAMPGYLKGHSQGEYIFDHAFADAFMRAGGRYYPKFLSAIPFTPATGPRLLADSAEERGLLLAGASAVARQMGLSGANLNFLNAEEAEEAEAAGYALRLGEQYHFEDRGYGSWDGFLSALSSRKRKALRKERDSLHKEGLEIEWVCGRDIEDRHLDAFWTFYQDTGARKWGTPYLTRTAFTLLAERMAERLLFIFAKRGEDFVAGALNVIGGDTLYGRYWGCTEYVPFLHFELCYYQAIDYALAHGLRRVEAGAQGEHKIARGYEPVATRSAHRLTDANFHDAVSDYLARERQAVRSDLSMLREHTPFKKAP